MGFRRGLWVPILALVGIGPAAAAATTVRVLLYEGHGPIRIAHAGFDAVLTARAGLRLDGRPAGSEVRFESASGVGVAGARYRGAVRASSGPRGMRVVNEVLLEDYVAGTLLREVYGSWTPEVLRSVAVVIRTYALHERHKRVGAAYDLRADTSSQVYGGRDAEGPAAGRAVGSTRGEILSYAGEPILAVYHATSGGRTASAEEVWGRPVPYLVSVAVKGEEESPDTYWRAPVSRIILGRALETLGHGVGAVRALEVSRRSASGRVRSLRVRGERGVAPVEAHALRRALGDGVLRSTRFEVREAPEGFVFVGSGRGHGVGLSQWGAKAMAEGGADYREILSWFYPGTRLERLDDRPSLPSVAGGAGR